jgi:hypothetical protein
LARREERATTPVAERPASLRVAEIMSFDPDAQLKAAPKTK